MPLFSIITVNKDNLEGLKRTAESVVSQTFKDFEWIVIDAASTDGSAEFVRQNESYMSYWVSEPDGGIYAGMNKGILKAKGKYLLFLNSGDCFFDSNVLKKVESAGLESDVALGTVNVCNSNGGVVCKENTVPFKDITLFSLYLYGIPHQAAFIRKDLFSKYGLYDVKYKINADWVFFLKTLVLDNCSLQHIDITVCNYDGTGVSSVNKEKLLKEREMAFKEYVPERIKEDYEKVFPHYYEMYRIEWLMKHPLFYKIYRGFTTLGIKMMRK